MRRGLLRTVALAAAASCSSPSASGSSRLERRSLKQCSAELDECRSSQAAAEPAAPGAGDYAVLTREATDAASALAASLAGSSAASGLPEQYERDGHVTLRGVWPAAVTRLVLQEVEEVWAHYRLPATFSGTAFIRAEKDNPRIDSSASMHAPFGASQHPTPPLPPCLSFSRLLLRLTAQNPGQIGCTTSRSARPRCAASSPPRGWASSPPRSWASTASHST